MICQNCGADLDEGAKFCRLCGSKLQELDKGVNVVQIKCEINNSVEYKPCQKTEITMITEQGTKDTTDVSGKLVKSRSFLKAGIIITAVILIAVLSKQWIYPDIIVPGIAYAKADKLLKQGAYEEAREQFLKLGEFWNAPEKVQDANNAELKQKYDEAQALMGQGEYLAAEEIFLSLRYFEDAPEKAEEAKNARLEIKYSEAVQLVEETKYLEAISIFEEIKDYKDATSRAEEVRNIYLGEKYDAALTLLNTENYEEAIAAFEEIYEFNDAEQQIYEAYYRIAEEKLENKQYYEAAIDFYALSGYKDAWERSFDTWGLITQRAVLAGNKNIDVAVRSDGRIAQSDDIWSYKVSYIEDWSNIISVTCTMEDIIGLREDGTVAVPKYYTGRDEISKWNGIVLIQADGYNTVGLKADGTVVTAGYDFYIESAEKWSNIISICTCNNVVVGLKNDGTVVAVGEDLPKSIKVNEWTDIVEICMNGNAVVGLRADGTVVSWAYSGRAYAECNYSFDKWNDVVRVFAGSGTIIGIKKDGTVLKTGISKTNMSALKGAKEICFSKEDYSGYSAMGLLSDGTVVTVSKSSNGKVTTVWTDILVTEKPELEFEKVEAIKEETEVAIPSSKSGTVTGSIDADLWDFLVNG